MKIYYLDEDVEKCARYHCDVHVSKMCVDYAQILSSAADEGGFFDPYRMYEPLEDRGGELVEWASDSKENYLWLTRLAKEIGKEYKYRYGEEHKSMVDVISKINLGDIRLPGEGFSPPPIPFSNMYRGDSVIESYRNYYNYGPKENMSWFNRGAPDWYHGDSKDFDYDDGWEWDGFHGGGFE